jgi:hypothetical protein
MADVRSQGKISDVKEKLVYSQGTDQDYFLRTTPVQG